MLFYMLFDILVLLRGVLLKGSDSDNPNLTWGYSQHEHVRIELVRLS